MTVASHRTESPKVNFETPHAGLMTLIAIIFILLCSLPAVPWEKLYYRLFF